MATATGDLPALPRPPKLDRITINPARMNGQPCIRDLRLTVGRVLEALAMYATRDELKRHYPGLDDDDITQVLFYAAQLFHADSDDES